jgi:hypothetical protein
MAEHFPPEQMAEIAALLRRRIEQFEPTIAARDVGTVIEVGDGIARVSGLSSVRMSELVEFSSGVLGMAFNLEADEVGVIVMGDYTASTRATRCAHRAHHLCAGGRGPPGARGRCAGPPHGRQRAHQHRSYRPSSASPPAWSSARTWTRRCRPASRPSTR